MNQPALRIDDEFRSYVPPLSDEERAQLEQNIRAEGCLTPLIVWGDILVDGHNRYEICTRLGLPFETVQRYFRDREAALDWMDAHQLGRRNLSPDARKLLLGRRYNRMKRPANDGGVGTPKATEGQSDPRFSTAATLAKEHGVSEKTVKRAGKFADQIDASPELKAAVAAGVPVAKARPKPEPAEIVPANDVGVSDAEARYRKTLAKLTSEALVDMVVGLDATLASETQRANRAEEAARKVQKDFDEILAANGDTGEIVRRFKAKAEKASSDKWRAEERTSAFIRENHVLKKKLKGYEAKAA